MSPRARTLVCLLAALVAAPAVRAAPAAAPAGGAQRWLWTEALGHPDVARLKRDAENGQEHAQMDYARYLLRQGRDAEAVSWLTQANQQGDVRAQYLLGMLYLQGRAVAQDFEQARYFLGKAADQGYAPAQFHLGRLLIDGPFVDPALENASPAQLRQASQRGMELLRRAAAAGYAPARTALQQDAPAAASRGGAQAAP